MDGARERQGDRLSTWRFAWVSVAWLLLAGMEVGVVRADEKVIGLADAPERGTFNVGAATATLAPVPNSGEAVAALKLDYSIPKGTSAGIYAKGFPSTFRQGQIDVTRLAIRETTAGQAQQIKGEVEIKGEAGTQRIPLQIQPENSTTGPLRLIDWNTIGGLKEIVVLLENAGNQDITTGTVTIDARFESLSFFQKINLSLWWRLVGVMLVSLVLAAIARLSRSLIFAEARETTVVLGGGAEVERPRGFLPDLIKGVGIALIAALAVETYAIGSRGPLDGVWTVFGLTVFGVLIGEWWKVGLTGMHLTARETFQDGLVTGLLAATASGLTIFQTPGDWSQVFLLSQTVSALAVLIYHAANAYQIASTKRHLGLNGAALIAGVPYVVGILILLESPHLVQSLGSLFSAGSLKNHLLGAEILGRILIVFGFNEAVMLGICLATGKTPPRSLKAHGMLLATAVAVNAAPWVASWGSGTFLAKWPAWKRLPGAVAATMLSQGALWAEVYLVTGLILDAVHGAGPSSGSIIGHPMTGAKKGMVYSGVFMGGLYLLGSLWELSPIRWAVQNQPILMAMLAGAIVYPLIATIIESFDGSPPFFERLRRNWRKPVLLGRGAVVGLGIGFGLWLGFAAHPLSTRASLGFLVGVTAYAGVDLLRDLIWSHDHRGRVQSPRYYASHAMLGGFIGAAIGFYLDAAQVAVITAKFHRYLEAGQAPALFDTYPLVSKWGHLNLGMVNGGVSLLFAEALAGVINWSTAAWLFAINRTFMRAYFWKDSAPVRNLFTKSGMVEMGENMIQVLRWGLWMSPIINSFLRPMSEPTWYNQDGAIRTLLATFRDFTMTPDAFRAWSLQVFTALLAYDVVRVLIWIDHMGLRVATLVNLSFLGMDRLEQRMARWLSPAATSRCIPESVKRFMTWAPLLLPFYIPRGADWDRAWSEAETIRGRSPVGFIDQLGMMPLFEKILWLAGLAVLASALCAFARFVGDRWRRPALAGLSLKRDGYELSVREDGQVVSHWLEKGFDLSRRSYDLIDPAGRSLFLVDVAAAPDDPHRFWPVVGNFPDAIASKPRISQTGQAVTMTSAGNQLRATIEVTLPATERAVELWTITIENESNLARAIKVVPYLEWILDRPDVDRGHTQYCRLFAEIEYLGGLNALLAWDKHSKATGFLASDRQPEGFLSSRVDFIGRGRSIWSPQSLETLAFSEPKDTARHVPLDAIGSLLIGANVPANGSAQIRLLMGFARGRGEAIEAVTRCFEPTSPVRLPVDDSRIAFHPIGHGEIPDGTPQPYTEYSEDGRSLLVHTPFTPRPFDHTLSNAIGQITSVTNRGLHTTASVNAQQNRLTPDWADTVTREAPGEVIYLYDLDSGEWHSPTYHPLNHANAVHESVFSVDGTATFRMSHPSLETELTVFVPPGEPATVYLLTIRNPTSSARRLRVAPYFQMVLAGQPEFAGPLANWSDRGRSTLFFENPRNTFRTGPAFVAFSEDAGLMETNRGRFLGEGGSPAHPFMVEHGLPAAGRIADDRPIAALLATLEIPANGEKTVVVLLGQADDRRQAEAAIRKLRTVEAAVQAMESTREWWSGLMESLRVETTEPEFDRYLDWLKYQALAERIWARRGFYQASGAYGFRDQLQDSLNLLWVDPAIARNQILLHASQQFIEGDVVHWFHRLQDGRTGFVGRTHASDNLLWLPWGVVEYLAATGDHSILDERTPYLEAEQPFAALPRDKQGMGFDPLRSTREDTIYRHCLKSIDLVLDHRMGSHGLPLMGTGDWNDGLDEIGSEGRGESVWLGFFFYYILDRMLGTIERIEGPVRHDHYQRKLEALKNALEQTWRDDRYLRAFHDDGTEIGIKGSGVWEIDALTAAWAVMSGINPQRGRIVFETAIQVLEHEKTILLGWPPLREDTVPYLGRSSVYPEGVRENGMYSHGVQWLVGAARILAEQARAEGRTEDARGYLQTAYRLWLKISPIPHTVPGEIETYGGQPNKQAADMVTTFDPGRMIWNGYTGAAGWMLRQALEGVLGLRLTDGKIQEPAESNAMEDPRLLNVTRNLASSPFMSTEDRSSRNQYVESNGVRKPSTTRSTQES